MANAKFMFIHSTVMKFKMANVGMYLYSKDSDTSSLHTDIGMNCNVHIVTMSYLRKI